MNMHITHNRFASHLGF